MTKLYSTDAFELLLGISEGEIGGVVGDTPEEKRQNIFIDDTPLYDSTGNANFDDSSLVLRFEPGTPYTAIEDAEEGQTPIWYAFGGRNISVSVDKQLDHSSSVTELTPTTTEGFDAIEVRFYIPQLVRYTNDGSKDHTLELRIEFRKAGETSWQSMEKTIEGKASAAPISRSFKFPVTRTSPDDRFEIRVTKLTEESTDKKVANVSWVGYELFTRSGNVYTSNTLEYDDSSLEYHPGTAMLQVVGVLGQQLDRVPTVSAVYDGLLCTIPSNYDPVTKTYDESVPWDGSFKVEKATTDNPFWIAHELITNTRMGLARHNPRIRVDRYSTYEKAKYADGYNPLTNIKDLNNPLTGETGVARYTFNAVIRQQQEGMDLINQIVGTAFGRAIDNDDGEIQFLMDMPTTPNAIITPEMCLDDSDHYIQFTYAFSDLNERFNAITSSILDKRQEYQQRFISEIRDEESISKYGLNQHEFKAVGCTDEWECQRRMYFFMNSVLTEITTVTFRMPLNSMEFELSDVVYLVDPTLKHGLSGRMVYGNVRTLQVRDPLYFDEATDYELTLQGIEQDYVYTITITADEVHTPITTFTLSDDLPAPTEYNDYPVISISNMPGSDTPVGFPKPWRITGISEIDETAGFHEITAVEINPNKHSAADLLTVAQMPDFSFQRPYRPTKVKNLRVLEQEHIETVDAQQVNLWIGWDEQEDLPAGAFYEVTVYENTRSAAIASLNVQESAVEIPNISRGEIRIRVVTWFGSLRSGQVLLKYNTENVLVAEMAAQGIAPLFTTSYENDSLEVFAELRYNYGSSTVTNIDLIAAGTVQGIRYAVYDDRDPQNRNLLTTLETNGPLRLGPQDFYKLIGHGDYTPSSLFIEAQVIDVEGSRYPADGQTPFELTVSPGAAAITSLTYNKVLSGTTYHRVTWDDNNYGYEVTLFKPDGKSVLSKTVVYDNEFSFGVLPEGTNYSIQVRGFNSSRAYGNPETILFSVAREITPTAEPAIVNNEGTIVLTPSEPTSPQASYEFKYGLVDNITSAVDATRGTAVTINNTVNNADYYIWYRLVSLEGKGSWIKKTVKANGQTLYTWKVYADDENGTGISTTADTKPFVGILSGQLVATPDISDPSIYAWLRNTSTEWLFGSGSPSAGIGNIGDSYLEQSTGNIYKKTAAGWGSPIGNLQGGDGDKFWSAPYHPDDASNPYPGSNGDLYINTLTFELYQKVNDVWTLQGVLKGTDGTPGADGKDAAYFRGFETTEEQDEIQLYTGVTKQAVNDSFSGTVAMEMSSTVVDGLTSGAGDTGYLTIPEPLALLFAGQKCVISVIAKQGSGSASPEFGLAYSTSDVGNSGWSRFTPTTSFVKYSFEYELPLPNNGGTDFLIINPDMTGGGGTLIVDHVQITIKGEKGDAGDNAQLYYIGYPNGLVIKNGVGTINLETHLLNGSEDSVLTGSSDPQLYDGTTALGRAVSLQTADIDGAKVIQLKNGSTVLDSVTVTDLLDGDSAVTGTTSYSNTLAWTQEKNGASSWLPGTYTSDITFTFYKDGATIATRVLRATLTAATGNIAITNVSTTGETTNYVVSSNGTASVSITVTHSSSGVKATESVLAVKSGEKGDAGISPSLGYLEEEATSFLALADGSLESGQFPYTNKFTIYEGQTDVTTSWDLNVAHSGTVNWSIAADGTITVNSLTSDKATLSVLATRTGYETVRKKWTLIKQKKGATGNPGDKGDTGDTGPQGVAGPKGDDGVTTYTWIKYADTSTGANISNNPSGKAYIGFAYNKTTSTESNTASDYSWSLIQGEKGDTGVTGPKGSDGVTTYTWIKYSANADGTGLTDSPQSNTKYIGIAPNKTSASESNNKSDYTWSLFKGDTGPQGVAGPKGADGQTTYTWIRYANNASGGGISNSPTGKSYIGFAYNKTTATESNVASDYTWSLIQGPQGNTGVQGPQGPNGQPTYTWIKYSANPDGSGLTDTPQSNTAYIGIATNKTTASESNNAGDYVWSQFKGDAGENASAVVGRPGQVWRFTDGAEDWTARNASLSATDGRLVVTGTNSDIGIISPNNLDIVGAANFALLVRLRTTSATHTASGELYYATNSHGSTGSYRVDFTHEYVQNVWTYLVLDCRELSVGGDDWVNSTITRLRIDFSNDGNGRTYEIDTVTLGYFGSPEEQDGEDLIPDPGNLITNPTGKAADRHGRAVGWKPIEGFFEYATVKYYPGPDGLRVGSAQGDTSVAVGYKAIAVNSHTKYRVRLRLKCDAAHGSGLFIRMQEYNSNLPEGATHVGNLGAPHMQSRSSYTELFSGGISNTYQWFEYTYTPPAGVRYVTLSVYNWGGLGTDNIWINYAEVADIEATDDLRNDNLTSENVRLGAGWAALPSSGANKVELDSDSSVQGRARFKVNGGGYQYLDVFSSGERTKLDRLRLGRMPGDASKYINRWADVNGDGRPDDYATVTGASSLAIDPTFERGFISINDANDWHLEADAGEFDDAALVFHGNNTRNNTRYTWLAREPQNGNYLDIPAKKGDRFKFVIRYACWGSPVGNFGFNVLGKDKNGTNSEYLVILNQGNVQVGTSATDFKTLETTLEVTQSITKYVQFYFYANQNMTQGSILFDNVEIWKIPASIDNDSVDEDHIKGKMSWTVSPESGANKTTNTNQLTDGANLGKKAEWGNVTGTGKPANDANKTDLDSGGDQGQMRYRLNDGSWVNVDVFTAPERTKLANLRQGKLPDGSRDVLDRDLATLNTVGRDVIDGRANTRIDAKRPDSAYKNSNTTKGDVGLPNVVDGANKVELIDDNTLGRIRFRLNDVDRYYEAVSQSQVDGRVTAVRPDSTYKNSNTTKAQVGLPNVVDGANKTEFVADTTLGRFRYRINGTEYTYDAITQSQVDGRVTSVRPDSAYKNSNTTKADVGLPNVVDGANKTEFVADSTLGRITYKLNGTTYTYDAVTQTQIDGRVTSVRPDSAYKNSNTTKNDVGLSLVDNKSSSTIRSEAVNDALANALLRNPSGEGINFFPPIFQNPISDDVLGGVVNGTASVNTTYDFNQPSRGSVIRMSSTANDAWVHLRTPLDLFPIKILKNRKWIVSFWVLNNSPEGAFSTNIYFHFKDSGNNNRYLGTVYTTPGAYSSTRRSVVLDMTSSYQDRNQATEVALRLDVDKNGAALVWDQFMIEPLFDNDAVPSPYRAPLTPAPILNAGNNLPMATLAGASATVKDISGGTTVLETSVSGMEAQISINTHTVQLPDKEVTYNSDNLTVTQGVRYFIYCDDPYGLGGSVTYYAVTSSQFSNLSAVSGRYWLGSITTASSSNPGGRDPDDVYCVAADMYLTNDLLAGDAKEGDIIDAWSHEKGFHKHPVVACPEAVTPCVRLITEAGAVIVSTTTPIDLRDGRTIAAINALGEDLLTLDSNNNEAWLPCVDIEYLAARKVIKINVGDESYAAGESPDLRIVTHNVMFKP